MNIALTYISNLESNVLIHDNGRACIADFGLSTLLTELGGSTFATSRQGGGALRWAAPELLNLDVEGFADEEHTSRAPPTPQSDTYSFGGIMLQVCHCLALLMLWGNLSEQHQGSDRENTLSLLLP
ncbi:hypothetical protein BS17DRAFT_370394 [Gyrodon lividus]|nr:hypothetical protein BS17DRAFT_370394 [Gyrodon lividus]